MLLYNTIMSSEYNGGKCHWNNLKSQEMYTLNREIYILPMIYKDVRVTSQYFSKTIMNPFTIFGVGDTMSKFVILRTFHNPDQVETSTDTSFRPELICHHYQSQRCY